MEREHDIATPTNHLKRRPSNLNLRIRPSGPGDRQRIQDVFDALSPESRRRRFFTAKRALSAAELDFFTSADGWDHIALAAIRLDQQGHEQEALGFIRCFRLTPDGDIAEFAVTVADAAQGQGIGRALADRLLEVAGTAGIRQLRCEVLADNQAMRVLAERMGGTARRTEDGTVEFDCPVPPPVDPAIGGFALPWFADPGQLLSACTGRWLEALDDALEGVQSAQEEVAGWLVELCRGEAVH